MRTRLKLHTSFDQCESEELVHIEHLQGPFPVLVFDHQDTLVAHSDPLPMADLDDYVEGLLQWVPWSYEPQTFRHEGAIGRSHLTKHHKIVELDLNQSTWLDDLELPEPRNNKIRFCQEVCDRLFEQLPYDRVMVYRFAPDGSGEVIAERAIDSCEPFIGLHYPATDIPKQARDLYTKTKARLIVDTQAPERTIKQTVPPIDLTQVVSRAVSPYHLKYLSNMGTGSTASVAIELDGKLWGLVSLHADTRPTISLALFEQLYRLSSRLSTGLRFTLSLSESAQIDRQQLLLERFRTHLSNEFDLAYSLLLSNFSLHRMVGGTGAAVMASNCVAQVGDTPEQQQTKAIFEYVEATGESSWFVHHKGELAHLDIPDSIGGFAFIRLAKDPFAGILIFRRSVVQTVSWGGDPRNIQKNTVQPRYTPRASFSRWIETVDGQCLPWDNSTQKLLMVLINALKGRFDIGNDSSIGVLLGYSIRQLAHSRTRLLQKLNEQFEQLRQGIAIAIQVGDAQPRSVLSINQAASVAFNLPSQEAEGMSLSRFAESTAIPFDQIESGQRRQVSIWTHDRGHLDIEVEVHQQFDFVNFANHERLNIVVYYLNDITQSKRVELALYAAYQQSEKVAKAQGEVFAKLMHELRTPLNSIIGFSAFLNEPGLTDTERADFIERIVRNAESLSILLEHSKEHTKSLRHEMSHESESCELNALVEECVADLSIMAAERNIELNMVVSELPVNALIARQAIRQVISNLLTNAIKYSQAGSSVEVVTRYQNGRLSLHVDDDGIGMTPDQLDQAFQPFSRFTNRPGSGLGLSIVKQLVDANDAELKIESSKGVGTRCSVFLPCVDAVQLPQTGSGVSQLVKGR